MATAANGVVLTRVIVSTVFISMMALQGFALAKLIDHGEALARMEERLISVSRQVDALSGRPAVQSRLYDSR